MSTPTWGRSSKGSRARRRRWTGWTSPDWKLSIEGHTDAVASDRSNLELSGRRAAAVRDALTAGFRITPGRRTTTGYGESRPQDRNDTVDGRARNRRVELIRQ
jgi:outer membrane protein OmpA-like peptidoglycan-associated protein